MAKEKERDRETPGIIGGTTSVPTEKAGELRGE